MSRKLSLVTIPYTRIAVIAATLAIPFFAGQVRAEDEQRPALQFHEILRSTLPSAMLAPEALSTLHMLPDQKILNARHASTIEGAIDDVKQTNLLNLVRETESRQGTASLDADAILRKEPITMVIIPGIFGEFIPTRAFEEVLAKESPDRRSFRTRVAAAREAGNPIGSDSTFDINALANKEVPLSEVVNVGNINDKDGKPLIRVVLMYTNFMSLESLGNQKEYAKIFNRRLSKYIALTGRQNIALVGYSRGTGLALEMLAQAREQNLPYLANVKGMVSLGGVIWGSALADDAASTSTATGSLLGAVSELEKNLDPSSVVKTTAAWAKFAWTAKSSISGLTKHADAPNAKDLKNALVPTNIDPGSIKTLLQTAFFKLGLNHPVTEFANNVRRFHSLVGAVLSGVKSLTTADRLNWWKTHEVPQNLTYYSITAAMPNPERSPLEMQIFNDNIGYSHRSYDDLMLLQNHMDYEHLDGLSLNDSQVGVPQAMFLPDAIANENPANAGLKTQMLGTLGTHHWGLALKIVNAMKDGRENPFPREAVLKALAAKVSLDDQTK